MSFDATAARRATLPVNARDNGAVGDGLTDDTAALAGVLAVGGTVIIPPGTYAIDPILTTPARPLTVINYGTILNRRGAAQTGALIRLGGTNGAIRWLGAGGEFDGAGTPLSLLILDGGAKHYLEPGRMHGITGTPLSGNSSSAIVLFNTVDTVIQNPTIYDVVRGTTTNDSVPRGITVDPSCTGTVINNPVTRNCNCAILAYGDTIINAPDLAGGTDNGVYISATVLINGGWIRGHEEPIVTSGGTLTLVTGTRIDGTSNAIGLQDCGDVIYSNCKISMVGPGNIIRTRSGNAGKAVGKLQFLGCDIRGTNDLPLYFATGALNELILRGNTIRLVYAEGRFANTNLISWAAGQSYLVKENDIILEGAWPSGDRFMSLPAVTGLSVYDQSNRLINRSGNPAATLRVGNNARVGAYIDRMFVRPGRIIEGALDQFWSALVTAGLHNRFDILHILALHSDQACLLNFANPRINALSLVGTGGTFRRGYGYAGNGVDSYLASPINPGSAGLLSSQTNANLCVWANGEILPQEDKACCGNTTLLIRPRTTANVIESRQMSASTDTTGTSNSGGLFSIDRSVAESYQTRKNGAALATKIRTGDALNTRPLWFGASNAGTPEYSTRELALVSYGPARTEAEELAFYNAANALLTTLRS